MFESLSLTVVLLLSSGLWFFGFSIPYVFNKEIGFLGVAPLILLGWLFQVPLTNQLANLAQNTVSPVWIVNTLEFLQLNPLVPAVLILLVFGIMGMHYLGCWSSKNDRFKLVLLMLSIIPSILFPLMSSRLLSAGWTAGLAVALLVEFVLFYFVKRIKQ